MSAQWTERFLALAAHVATWSKDPSTKVGAVIADSERRVIGLGYNGFPRGVMDSKDRLAARDLKLALTMHAEPNAILNATASVRDCTMYVSCMPCSECAKYIVQAGIFAVVCPEPSAELAERWARPFEIARMIFEEAHVNLRVQRLAEVPA